MNTPVGSPERLLGEAVAAGDAAPLSQQEIRPLFDEAVTRWSAALGDAEAAQRLRSVRVEIMDLPGTTLGLASGAVIYLDANGAGHGWFLDPTPWEDSEFAPGLADSPAAGRVDLLTVMAHEMGHILGLDDDSATDPFTGNVMADVLPLGVRRIHLEGLLPTPSARHVTPAVATRDQRNRSRTQCPPTREAGWPKPLPADAGSAMTRGALTRSGGLPSRPGPAASERDDEVPEAAAPRMAGPPEPLPAEDFAPGLPAAARAVRDDRRKKRSRPPPRRVGSD